MLFAAPDDTVTDPANTAEIQTALAEAADADQVMRARPWDFPFCADDEAPTRPTRDQALAERPAGQLGCLYPRLQVLDPSAIPCDGERM
jgi:hypothetical protein